MAEQDIKSLVREVMQEFVDVQLGTEQKRREELEKRLNDLVDESKRHRLRADEVERGAAIRDELQSQGVAKIDLAFRAMKDDIHRADDGRLVARGEGGETSLREYVARFVNENPELLPARIAGGSGTGGGQRTSGGGNSTDLDTIRPGMDPEEMEKIRREIARIASQSMRGLF